MAEPRFEALPIAGHVKDRPLAEALARLHEHGLSRPPRVEQTGRRGSGDDPAWVAGYFACSDDVVIAREAWQNRLTAEAGV